MCYRKNDIIHITSGPYYPAERMVQELKRALAKGGKEELQCILASSFKQNMTIHMSTGNTLARMILGNKLPSLFTRLVPPREQRSLPAKKDQKKTFCHDQSKWVREFLSSHTWMPGKVVSRVGPRPWLIDTTRDQVRRHQNLIRLSGFEVNVALRRYSTLSSFHGFWRAVTLKLGWYKGSTWENCRRELRQLQVSQ